MCGKTGFQAKGLVRGLMGLYNEEWLQAREDDSDDDGDDGGGGRTGPVILSDVFIGFRF